MNLLYPHHPEFPFRRRIVLVATSIGAAVSLVWPDLSLAERIAAPCATILISGLVYVFVLGILKLLMLLPRFIFVTYAYVFFYGGILSVLLFPFVVSSMLHDLSDVSAFEKALWLSGAIPQALALAAGAYVAIESERNPAQQTAQTTTRPKGRAV